MKHIDPFTASRIVRAFEAVGGDCAETFLPMMAAGKVGAVASIANNLSAHYSLRPAVGEVLNQWAQIMRKGEDHDEFGPSPLRAYLARLEDLLGIGRP